MMERDGNMGKFKEWMRHASQSKTKSNGRVQGNNEIILASVVGIGLRQLQPNYGQGFFVFIVECGKEIL